MKDRTQMWHRLIYGLSQSTSKE